MNFGGSCDEPRSPNLECSRDHAEGVEVCGAVVVGGKRNELRPDRDSFGAGKIGDSLRGIGAEGHPKNRGSAEGLVVIANALW